jgi:hypothetical protein
MAAPGKRRSYPRIRIDFLPPAYVLPTREIVPGTSERHSQDHKEGCRGSGGLGEGYLIKRVNDLTKIEINKVLKDIMVGKTRVKTKKLRGKGRCQRRSGDDHTHHGPSRKAQSD